MRVLIDDLIVGSARGLIQGKIDGHSYAFNPCSSGSLVLLSQRGQELLDRCSTETSVHELKSLLTWTRKDPWQLTDLLNTLAAHGIVNLGRENSGFASPQQKQGTKQAMSVWLQMTDACNLRCSYCYVSKHPKHISLETAKALVSKIGEECRIAGFNSLKLKCAGGEPTIRWDVLRPFLDWWKNDAGRLSSDIVILTRMSHP